MNFTKNNKIVVVEGPAAAAQTALTSDIVDLSEWDGVTFVLLTGDVSSGSVLGLNVEHGDEAAGGDMVDTTVFATFSAGASDADGKALVAELHKPIKRYARAVATRTTADAVIGGILAILHGPKRAPITPDATVLDTELGVAAPSA